MAGGAAQTEPPHMRGPWLWALVGVAVVAIVLFVLWWGPWLFARDPDHELTAAQVREAENDVRTTLVQSVGGLVLAGGLVVTYRTFRQNQRDQVKRWEVQDNTYQLNRAAQVTDTYSKAVEQLGSEHAPVRLGALYSLENLAQDNPSRRQNVVDVLCAYLRMPYTPPTSDNPSTESEPAAAEDANPADADAEERKREAAQELQVRQTAQRRLAEHLRRPEGTSREDVPTAKASHKSPFWPGMKLDLTRASLVNLEMMDISVAYANFDHAEFFGDTQFTHADFAAGAWFNHAKYHGAARFEYATFSRDARFEWVKFVGSADFGGAEFGGQAFFGLAEFDYGGWFNAVKFVGGAGFGQARFIGGAAFGDAEFIGGAWFGLTKFLNFSVFDGASFSGDVWFDGAEFSADVTFEGARVLKLDLQKLNKFARVWPAGWSVRRDTGDPTLGTLVRQGQEGFSEPER
ncbi:MAG TPA: pentapeptide repeat-containing protein [Kribbellaceae bacterium]|nr:pentapeptide repeat-containing protein [Kribbellaceae bacterium]